MHAHRFPEGTFRFSDLGHAIEEIHALFDGWADANPFAPALDEDGLVVMKLAVHEWVANLVQHARFARAPRIQLALEEAGADGVRCAIEDNSEGFDFRTQLGHQADVFAQPSPSERGRGLLMLIACTEDLSYHPAQRGRHRLEFTVRRTGADADMAPLFRSAGQ